MDLFRDLSESIAFSSEKMKKNGIFSSERFFCDVYAFEPGQEQAGHVHEGSDKVYVVLDGEGDFRVDDETRRRGPGSVIYCPTGSEHEVRNPGPGRLTLLVFMAPPPPPKKS